MTTKDSNSNHLTPALASGIINALINGLINWFQVRGKDELYLTVDSITNHEHTVLGGAVLLAATLAAILTMISYATVKSPGKPPFFPKALLLTARNAFFAFGVLVTLSIIIQRFAGSIAVSPFAAALIVAIIAGLVAGIVDYMTKTELLKK
jgi:hypothetical protein